MAITFPLPLIQMARTDLGERVIPEFRTEWGSVVSDREISPNYRTTSGLERFLRQVMATESDVKAKMKFRQHPINYRGKTLIIPGMPHLIGSDSLLDRTLSDHVSQLHGDRARLEATTGNRLKAIAYYLAMMQHSDMYRRNLRNEEEAWNMAEAMASDYEHDSEDMLMLNAADADPNFEYDGGPAEMADPQYRKSRGYAAPVVEEKPQMPDLELEKMRQAYMNRSKKKK